MRTALLDAAAVGDDLRARWAGLVAADPTAGTFHGPRFLDAYRSSIDGGAIHERWTAERDGELVGTAGHELVDRVLRFAGGVELTDYQSPVAAPAERADVAAAWVEDLAGRLVDGEVERFVGEGLATTAPNGMPAWPDLLAEAAGAAGLEVRREVHEVCPRVDLADGHDAWMERLDGRQRQEMKRKARKLARDLGGLEVVEATDRGSALDRFLGMAVTDDSPKGDFFRDDAMQQWFRDLFAAFQGDDVLRVHELVVGGLPAASMVSLVEGGAWSLYNSAFEARMGPMGVGMVLTGELVRVAAEDGAEVFDFLQGDEAYKYQFGAVDLELARLSIGPGAS